MLAEVGFVPNESVGTHPRSREGGNAGGLRAWERGNGGKAGDGDSRRQGRGLLAEETDTRALPLDLTGVDSPQATRPDAHMGFAVGEGKALICRAPSQESQAAGASAPTCPVA